MISGVVQVIVWLYRALNVIAAMYSWILDLMGSQYKEIKFTAFYNVWQSRDDSRRELQEQDEMKLKCVFL